MLTAFLLTVSLSADPNREYARIQAEIMRSHNRAWDASIAEGVARDQVGGVQRHIANQPYVAPATTPRVDTYWQERQVRELQRMNRLFQQNQPYYVPYYPRYRYYW